jgi:hypothetical protein
MMIIPAVFVVLVVFISIFFLKTRKDGTGQRVIKFGLWLITVLLLVYLLFTILMVAFVGPHMKR